MQDISEKYMDILILTFLHVSMKRVVISKMKHGTRHSFFYETVITPLWYTSTVTKWLFTKKNYFIIMFWPASAIVSFYHHFLGWTRKTESRKMLVSCITKLLLMNFKPSLSGSFAAGTMHTYLHICPCGWAVGNQPAFVLAWWPELCVMVHLFPLPPPSACTSGQEEEHCRRNTAWPLQSSSTGWTKSQRRNHIRDSSHIFLLGPGQDCLS